jgi:hypothetical protein
MFPGNKDDTIQNIEKEKGIESHVIVKKKDFNQSQQRQQNALLLSIEILKMDLLTLALVAISFGINIVLRNLLGRY